MHPTTSTRFEHDDGFMGRMAGSPPIAWLLICFVLVWAPHTYRYVKHHPDERHYTDAAVAMVQSGDYLTPRTADGGLRLKKPILTYWLVATSYRVLGISPLTSRLPFPLGIVHK